MIKRKTKKSVSKRIKKVVSIVCTIAVVACVSIKAGSLISNKNSGISALALGFSMPVGAKAYIENGYAYEYANGEIFNTENGDLSEFDIRTADDKSEISDNANNTSDRPIVNENDGTQYSIIERKVEGSGTYYDGFWVKNSTQNSIDIAKELEKKPDATIVYDGSPQVLIVHTHTSESYIDKDLGYYTSDFYPRSTDQSYNIVAVGEAIKQQLEGAGIVTIHDTTVHDNPSYNGAYTRAADTITKNLEYYPSLQVVLDIHRDSIGNDESGRVKPTFTYNGKKAAQVMIISGCNDGGSWYFPDWEYNLRLALRIQQKGEHMYPGMMRPLNFSESEYNMSITHNSLLIEIGSDVNTFDEAVYSGELLGNVLKEVILEL